MRNVSFAPLHKKQAAKIPNLLIAVNAGGPIGSPTFGNLGVGGGSAPPGKAPALCGLKCQLVARRACDLVMHGLKKRAEPPLGGDRVAARRAADQLRMSRP
jgi:hypothetical protein